MCLPDANILRKYSIELLFLNYNETRISVCVGPLKNVGPINQEMLGRNVRNFYVCYSVISFISVCHIWWLNSFCLSLLHRIILPNMNVCLMRLLQGFHVQTFVFFRPTYLMNVIRINWIHLHRCSEILFTACLHSLV